MTHADVAAADALRPSFGIFEHGARRNSEQMLVGRQPRLIRRVRFLNCVIQYFFGDPLFPENGCPVGTELAGT